MLFNIAIVPSASRSPYTDRAGVSTPAVKDHLNGIVPSGAI